MNFQQSRERVRWNNALLVAMVTMALSLAGTTPAKAAIIDDDFESYTANTSGNLDPPWTDTGNVFATGSAAQSPFGSSGDKQGANFNDNNTTNNPAIVQSGLTIGNSSGVFIQFDFKSVGAVGNPSFQVRDGSTNGLNLHMMSFGAGTEVQVNQQGSGFGDVGTTLSTDTWYRFTLTLDPENTIIDNFDMRIQTLESPAIDDSYTNLLFQNNLNDFENVRLHFNTNGSFENGQYHIDNFLVTTDPNDLDFSIIVPEPSAIALLGLGLVSLRFVGWRRRRTR